MKTVTKKQRSALTSIRNSKGRFFGLYTLQGGVYNAQLVNETENYITIRDRNNDRNVKLAKTSIDSVNIAKI
jgi:hypothetical protein